MQKKILVIDYLSYTAHQNFNKIHIDILVSMGHSLCLVGRKDQFKHYQNIVEDIIYIPERYYKEYPCKPVTVRLFSIGALLWTRRNINIERFDIVLFPTYDIMSLWVFRTSKLTLLINHNNISQLDSRIKLFLTRTLPMNYQHITLNLEMTARLKQLDTCHQVTHIPHGIVESVGLLNTLPNRNKKYFFCPINRNYDHDFCRKLFDSKIIHDFLYEKNIKLYLKQHIPYSGMCKHIEVLDDDMSYSDYINLLRDSSGVILPYSTNFKYRCSGIFFECVAYDVPIIARDISAFRLYRKDNNLCLFNDVDSLLEAMTECLEGRITPFDKNALMPKSYWYRLLMHI